MRLDGMERSRDRGGLLAIARLSGGGTFTDPQKAVMLAAALRDQFMDVG